MMKRFLIFTIPLAIVLYFQACDTRIRTEGTQSSSTQNNGDFYTGKPGIYTQVDAQTKCSQLSLNGNPFPNRIVQYDPQARRALLVRENCSDIETQVLAESTYSFSSDGLSLVYQGVSFAFQVDESEFNLISPVCPPGRTRLASTPVNFNLLSSPLHLSQPAWMPNPGIETFLYGSLEALPRYAVRRMAGGPFDHFRRVSQYLVLGRSRELALSFLVEPGNTPSASIMVWEGGDELIAFLDFATGTAGITYSNGLVSPSVSVQRYDTGYHFTVFFTTTATARGTAEIGVAPNRSPNGPEIGQAGDFIYVTAAALHHVSDYCQ